LGFTRDLRLELGVLLESLLQGVLVVDDLVTHRSENR
jgi:hypothetical protein